MLQKLNKVIQYLNDTSTTFNDLTTQWASALTYVTGDGLTNAVDTQLNTWETDGTLNTLINQQILGDVQGRLNAIEYLATDYTGVVGDGATDITNAFKLACDDVISKNGVLKLPKGTFVLSAYTLASMNVPAIIGEGRGQTILLVHGSLNFHVSNNFRLEDLTIQTDFTNPTTTVTVSNFFVADNPVSFTLIRNVEVVLFGQATDGSQRINTLFRGHTSHSLFENIRVDGSRMPIVVSKVAGTPCTNITFRNILMTNTQTGIYMVGADLNTPNLSDSEWIEDVTFDNVRLVNTSAQAAQYQAINGSDVLMLQRVRRVRVINLYGYYACERLAYFNGCQNVRLTNPMCENTEGVKFCGYVSTSKGASYYGDTLSIDVLTMKSGPTRQGRALTLYDVKNVEVGVIHAFDPSSLGSSLIDCVVLMENYCENVHIDHVNAENILRGVVQFNMVYSNDYTSYLKDIYFNGINAKNAVTTGGYAAIRSIIDSNFTSGYLYENINVMNANVRQTYADGADTDLSQYHSTSFLQGLINIDRVTRLRTKNNVCEGFSNAEGWLIVGANSYDVVVDEKIWSLSQMVSGYYFSQGSRFEHIEKGDKTKQGSITNRITIMSDSSDSLKTIKSDTSQAGVYDYAAVLSYGDEIKVPWNATSQIAKGSILSDSGEYMDFVVTPAGVVKVTGTTNTDIANTDTKLCVYLTSGSLYFRNRLGSSGVSHKILYKMSYLTKA